MASSLTTLETPLAIVRLPPDAGLPWWAAASSFLSLTRTAGETSLVCDASRVPPGQRVETGFRALVVRGPLPFEATGILASFAGPLAQAGIPILVVSTFDTDYVLVRESSLVRAVAALRAAGHWVSE